MAKTASHTTNPPRLDVYLHPHGAIPARLKSAIAAKSGCSLHVVAPREAFSRAKLLVGRATCVAHERH